MKDNTVSLLISLESSVTTICINKTNSNTAFGFSYMNNECQDLCTFFRINKIDIRSKHEITVNAEFRSFINKSIDIIQSKNSFHYIRLEELEDNDFAFNKFRLTFHVVKEAKASILHSLYDNGENFLYKKIQKVLFKHSKELRKQMVIDERFI